MRQFEELIKRNRELIDKALTLDNNFWGLEKEFNNLFDNSFLIELEPNKNYMILYQGEINITKLICEQAISKKSNIIFILNDEYLATNKLIVRIATQIIKEEKLPNIIKIYNNIEDKRVFEGTDQVDEVIFIGGAFEYREVKNKIKCKITWIEVEDEEV